MYKEGIYFSYFRMQHFDYEDITLLPQKWIVSSRSQCDTSVTFGWHTFKTPVVPANMVSVINESLCIELATHWYFYVMHRFDIDTLWFIKKVQSQNLIASISVGVTQERYDIIIELSQQWLVPEFITIDIAHGHSQLMESMIHHIQKHLPWSYIIAWNISTTQGALDLVSRWARGVKCGIWPWSACSTYTQTGFGSRGHQLSSVHHIAQAIRAKYWDEICIIADWWSTQNAHFTMSIALGADMTMSWWTFSRLSNAPWKTIEVDGITKRIYHGSASKLQPGKSDRFEWFVKHIDIIDQTYLEKMHEIEQAIQSAISYAWGRELMDLRKVEFLVR
jgi:GMP reductase